MPLIGIGMTSEFPVLPDELVDRIARLSGFNAWLSSWSKVSSRFRPVEWLRQPEHLNTAGFTLVPDDVPTSAIMQLEPHAHIS